MKLSLLEFMLVMSNAMYVFTTEDDVNFEELVSYMKEDAKRLVRNRKNAE